MRRVLFICMGNICRSPLAQGIFEQEVKRRKLEDLFDCDSAGTHSYHQGRPADERSQAVARAHGIDISMQRSRPLVTADYEWFDDLICMDEANCHHVLNDCPEEVKENISLLMSYSLNDQEKDVPDPYYDEVDGFRVVFEMITRGVNGFLDQAVEKEN